MADVEIRLARDEDVDAIHQLEVLAFPAPWRREFYESELRASGRLNLVAVLGSELVGYVFAMFYFDEMHVNKIAVHEHARRQGIAGRLMDACITFAREHGITSISLEVRKSNTGAQEFYGQLDFAATYVRPRYYPDGESAVVMSKTIR